MQCRHQTHQDPQRRTSMDVEDSKFVLFSAVYRGSEVNVTWSWRGFSPSINRERERVGVRLRTLTLLCLSMPCPPVTWMINVLPLSSKWGIEASIDSVFPLGSPQVQKKAQVRSTVCIHSLLLALHNPISVLRNLPSILLLSCLC
jgi:hypothetical protein